MVDCIAPGLLLGQIIGRWGTSLIREAFGGYTDSLLAMQLPVSAVRENEITQQMWAHVQTVGGVEMIQVHPTFLYEGTWNLCILILLLIYRKRRSLTEKFFCCILWDTVWDGAWIEGLRTDQLLIHRSGDSGCLRFYPVSWWWRQQLPFYGNVKN